MALWKYVRLTLEGLEYEAAYSDYWTSTAADDGQVVDAVIMPVAPHAAVVPGIYYHQGKDRRAWGSGHRNPNALRVAAYTAAINLLNYSAAVIPVTKADKAVDLIDNSYQPLNDIDKLNWDACL
jgi:amidase